MFLMYTDESGDTGLVNSPTRFYVLTGLVMHELRWRECLDQLIDFRRRMRATFGLKLREEIHATELINKPGPLQRIKKHDRLTILRMLARELSSMPNINVINVVVDKQSKPPEYDCFSRAWQALIQRFENTMRYHNFPGPRNADDRGLILPDRTDDKKLVQLLRRMRYFNPVPNQTAFGMGSRNLQIKLVVEDPAFRDSTHSYFVQACDTLAYLLKQRLDPSSFMRKKGGNHYFNLLSPILCKAASTKDPDGIVRL